MKKNHIILFQPKIDLYPHYSCFWAPLSLLSISAPLANDGYKVTIIDGNLDGSQTRILESLTNQDDILFIGVSMMIGGNQIERGIDFVNEVKSMGCTAQIIAGGPAAAVIPDKLVNSNLFDAVIRGQGETPISLVAKAIRDNGSLDNIAGVITKENPNKSIPALENKNNFPPYPWHLIDVEQYIRSDPFTGLRTLNYVSSQGCPNKCGYCSEELTCNSKWTALTAERTFNEVSDLVKKYNLSGIKFYDSNFFADVKRVIQFSNLILKSGLNFKWSASAHPREIIKLGDEMSHIREAGLSRLLIGFESGHQAVLDYVQKGTKVEDNLEVARICTKNKLSATFTYIIGFPGITDDTDPTCEQALEIKRINPSAEINIHFFYPFPGSKLYGDALKFGFNDPKTLTEFSNNDYYSIQTPWVEPGLQDRIQEFQRQAL